MSKSTEIATVTEFAALAVPQAEIAEILAANLGGDTIRPLDLDRIRIPAGGGLAWEVPTLEGVETATEVQGIIVHWQPKRVMWKTEFSGGGLPPDCSSEDGIAGFGDPGGECIKCPFGQFGGGCPPKEHMFILRPTDIFPILLPLPTMSVASARKYRLRLASAAVPVYAVLTRFSLEKAKNTSGIEYSRLVLNLAERLPAETVAKVRAYAEELKPRLSAVRVTGEDYEEE